MLSIKILLFTVSDTLNNVNEEKNNINEYKKYFYKQGIAEGADVFTYGNSIPLEYNIVFLNGGKTNLINNLHSRLEKF